MMKRKMPEMWIKKMMLLYTRSLEQNKTSGNSRGWIGWVRKRKINMI